MITIRCCAASRKGGIELLAFDLRGHGGSEGRFEPASSMQDCRELCMLFHDPTDGNAVVAHSAGSLATAAMSAETDALVLLAPYVAADLLSAPLRRLVNYLHPHQDSRIVTKLDDAFELFRPQWSSLRERWPALPPPPHVHGFLRSAGALGDLDLRGAHIEQPYLFLFPDKDDSLGTRKPERYAAYRAAVAGLGLRGEDASELAAGLNHCFNRDGLVPFMKEESGKDREAILERIVCFLEKHASRRG